MYIQPVLCYVLFFLILSSDFIYSHEAHFSDMDKL